MLITVTAFAVTARSEHRDRFDRVSRGATVIGAPLNA
ncbi:hypothetical protein JOF37_000433 [Microbacterium imperiale]|nr:hypothetical protein [Microbacterium imperiale]